MTNARVFKEDPLRMLRAFSLRAGLGFKIDGKTLSQIKKDKDLILKVSEERIREEFFKVLKSDNTAKILIEMDSLGLLDKIIPQIKVMFACKQGGYHHLDVWKHTKESLVHFDKLQDFIRSNKELNDYCYEVIAGEHNRLSLIKFAILLHDIGKPDTFKKENGKISFHGHERVGKKIVNSIAWQMKLSTEERHALEDIVLWHLRPGFLSDLKKPTPKAIYRFFRDTKKEAVSILLLSIADQRATRGPMSLKKDIKHHEKMCLSLINKYFEVKKDKPFERLADGNEIMRYLKIKPSIMVGKILGELVESQNLGKIKTKKEALLLAEKIYSKLSKAR